MYVIAVKREERADTTLADALDRIRDVEGLRFLDDASGLSARVQADDNAIWVVVARLKNTCHIEMAVAHLPQQLRQVEVDVPYALD